MIKRAFALFLASITVIVLLSAPAAAAPKKGDISLLTNAPGALTLGSAAWLPLVWESTKEDVQNFTVVVDSVDTGISVGYPSEGSETGLWQDHILSKYEVDFTAIYIDVPADFSGKEITLNLTARFGKKEKPNKNQSFSLVVPIAQHSGDDVVQVTLDLGAVEAGDAVWADIQFKGLAPVVTGFKVEILDGDGVPYVLPQGSFTSLDGNAQLDKGESDVVRLYVDATSLGAGSHEIQISTSWMFGSEPRSMDSSVTLQVAATP
jgi:hypothetical protein